MLSPLMMTKSEKEDEKDEDPALFQGLLAEAFSVLVPISTPAKGEYQ